MKNIAMDDFMDEAARLSAQEIDREMMESIEAECLLGNGWKESPLRKPWGPFSNWEAETAQWCHLNCTGDYKYVLSHWWFENPADATAFTLKFA